MRKVNGLLKQGWELQGPLSIKYPTNALLPMYGQALVWRHELAPPASSPSSSGCLGVVLLCALIPAATATAVHLL